MSCPVLVTILGPDRIESRSIRRVMMSFTHSGATINIPRFERPPDCERDAGDGSRDAGERWSAASEVDLALAGQVMSRSRRWAAPGR